jgi:hypothetical protein
VRDLNITNVTGSDGAVPFMVDPTPVSGIKLLGQRVLIILLTNVSEELRALEGSTFNNIFSSGSYDDDYAYMMLYSAIYRTIEVIKADTTEYPASETLRDIDVTAVTTAGDTVYFTITVYNKEGESTQVATQAGGL